MSTKASPKQNTIQGMLGIYELTLVSHWYLCLKIINILLLQYHNIVYKNIVCDMGLIWIFLQSCKIKNVLGHNTCWIWSQDECTAPGGDTICPHGRCINRDPGYYCLCDPGFIPTQDQKACLVKNYEQFMGLTNLLNISIIYSQTCLQRPPSGPQICGRYWQEVVV